MLDPIWRTIDKYTPIYTCFIKNISSSVTENSTGQTCLKVGLIFGLTVLHLSPFVRSEQSWIGSVSAYGVWGMTGFQVALYLFIESIFPNPLSIFAGAGGGLAPIPVPPPAILPLSSVSPLP